MDMNHLIGQRFNLISKSDIRYVGTLHEINPEASTIALENVQSFGTEGRRGNPAEEVAPSTSVYEYIVFRGSDVKDISVAGEEKQENTQPEPPRVPDDPAILGQNASRPAPGQGPEAGSSAPGLPPQQPQGAQQPPPGYPQQPQFQQGFYPPYGQRFPPPPFPPGPGGYPNMPYGAPPGWYPPPGPGFPQGPGQFPPQMPMGGPGQQPPPPQQRPEKIPSKPVTPAAQNAPPPPVESKPSVAEAVQGSTGPKAAPGYGAAQRNGRAMPAIPIAAPKPVVPMPTAPAAASQGALATDATTAAANAVAAAMAKLPQPGAQMNPGQPGASVDAVTRKMNEMRPYDGTQAPRGGHQYPRGGRGGARTQHKKIEIPKSDYDFETANAKFNKQDLVKEAIATGSPAAEAESHEFHEQEVDDSATHHQYNRTSSFFDNISSEARDREENSAGRIGGREWRGEEEKRNIETFGQGSVDGYGRGRGRGRGRGFGRGRGYRGGYGGRGRGGMRGGRAPSQSTGIPSQV
ncbi:Lsm14 N-terminal [Penicillium cosmopolitanum]|uniref:Lsm14 N-terminal n=1 Tax=Penicillium cosmopolitanum TaxID=1131564 RepID=A0A9W9VY17_9EURO|nr:Lsm14 N-terminal [Penicillium cosmopolitanum]KAJ5391548.1 Lsm14 N-terminal [Penicillium cosmopolitanum]